jgi:hypothetical protein
MFETSGDQGLKIVGLELGRDLTFEALPGIAGTLNEFDCFRHVHHGDTEARRKAIPFIEPF